MFPTKHTAKFPKGGSVTIHFPAETLAAWDPEEAYDKKTKRLRKEWLPLYLARNFKDEPFPIVQDGPDLIEDTVTIEIPPIQLAGEPRATKVCSFLWSNLQMLLPEEASAN